MDKKFDSTISIIRVLAMLSIIVGHWCAMMGINDYQLLAIGVEIFLLISGFLYRKKEIPNALKWIGQRWKRLIPPYWISLALVISIRILIGLEIRLDSIIICMLNLQGLDRIFLNLDIHGIPGIGQVWFLSVLAVAYALMIVLKKKKEFEEYISEHRCMCLIVSVFGQFVFVYAGIQIVYIICFFIGYFWGSDWHVDRKQYGFITLSLMVAMIIRLISRSVIDGTNIYDHIIARWSFIILAIWSVVTLTGVCNVFKKLSGQLARARGWKLLDLASYPMFLTHYMFSSGDFAVNKWINGIFNQTLVMVVFTIISAVIIMIITDFKGIKKVICV